MMRSLFSGVAGLKTHQTKMDVIGNNIANVNTTAYKASSIVFSELMSQTTQRASGPNAATGTGGTNARQIGLGVKSGAININISGQGSAQSTGNPFDIMITGSNFFVVNNGLENFFTRDGSFYVDGGGNLAMTSTGYNVMGWQVDPETGKIKKDTVSALRIMSKENLTYPPEATSKAYLGGIVDKFDTDVTSINGKSVNLNFYDNMGYSYTAKLTFKQSNDPSTYSLEFTKLLDAKGNEVPLVNEKGEDVRTKIFGSETPRIQKKNATIKLDTTGYAWDAGNLKAGTEVVAYYKSGDNDYPYRTVDDTAFSNLDDAGKKADAKKALEVIAKAHGYEGALDDFLHLQVMPKNATATTEPMDIANILKDTANYGRLDEVLDTKVKVEDPANPGTMIDQSTWQVVSTQRSYYGYEVVFDKGSENGKIESVNSSVTNLLSKLNLSLLGENFSDIEIDMSTLSSVDNKGTSTVGATSGDLEGFGTGRRNGDMIGVSVQNNGMIYASYDNGMTKLLGQIASASFANASGLEKKGDNLYSATMNSGQFDGIGEDITANGGYMSTGQLEMSNVDLSSEFTEMITTQRGFQANSRIITVSDTLLEELTNLKR